MPLTKTTYSMIQGAVYNVLDYGADNTGTTNTSAACQAAIDACIVTGGTVFFPEGTYLLTGQTSADSKTNGLVIPYTSFNSTAKRIKLVGTGASSILKANSDDMYIVRFCDSHGGVESLTIDGTGKTGVTGLGVVPQNITQTTTLVFQIYNYFNNLYIRNCAEGIELKTGPQVGGSDSGCWYNSFNNTWIYQCLRGIWLRDAPTTPASGCNRNYFTNMRIGQATNTGIQIDDGGTNNFVQVHIEGVDTGTSPNTTPTGIYIKQTGASGGDNNSNKFFGCVEEAVTRSLNNANAYSEFYGCEFSFPYSMILTANPKVLIGSDPSLTPQFLPGYTYQSNSQLPANPNTIMETTGIWADTFYAQRKNEGTGPGGSSLTFDFPYPYDVTAVYLVSRGGYVDSSNYAMRSSYWYETAQGTFTEQGTKLLDVSAGGVTWTTDTVTRSAGNSGSVRSTVHVAKAGATFTNWASIMRVA